MREIEFRGKRLDNGEWAEGFLYCFYNFTRTVAQILTDRTNGIPDAVEVDPETVGQYIGLKDRRGQKVFEGDIIDLFDNTFYVGFEEGEYILKSPESDDFLSILLLQTEKFYVEGNVYDNPELIVKR